MSGRGDVGMRRRSRGGESEQRGDATTRGGGRVGGARVEGGAREGGRRPRDGEGGRRRVRMTRRRESRKYLSDSEILRTNARSRALARPVSTYTYQIDPPWRSFVHERTNESSHSATRLGGAARRSSDGVESRDGDDARAVHRASARDGVARRRAAAARDGDAGGARPSPDRVFRRRARAGNERFKPTRTRTTSGRGRRRLAARRRRPRVRRAARRRLRPFRRARARCGVRSR